MSISKKHYPAPGGPLKRVTWWGFFLLCTLWGLTGGTAWGQEVDIDNADCLECHGEPDAEPRVDPVLFGASMHADNSCVGCHSDITEPDHDVPLAKVDCAECHALESEIYLQSSHGIALRSGRDMAASCRDCHGDAHAVTSSRDPASPTSRLNVALTCASCHGDVEAMRAFHLNQAAPIASYEDSVHGRALADGSGTLAAVCTDCHGSHDLRRATETGSKLHWRHISQTCGKCHENTHQTYERSVHGLAIAEGNRDAPVCTDCHGEHNIADVKSPDSKVYATRIAGTCSECHSAQRIVTRYQLAEHAVETYMDSYHGLAMRLGSVTAANCASCHGNHDILPSSDPRSSVHPENLSKTCGKCHAGVGDLVARGQIHSGTRPGAEHRAVSVVRRIYVWLFVVVLGGMLFHNGLDLYRKLREHYREMDAHGIPHRMNVNERIQHAILAVTFIVLGYTGFALKFPDAWWARPFIGQFDWRGYGHKVTAVVFCALALFHFIYVVFTKRGRWQLAQLRIRFSDIVHGFQMLGFYLHLRTERAKFGYYSYIEKMEYWALVWGSVVMAVTGALMTYEEWTLRLFPKWIYDVMTAIHYYEAILACLAIIIWHFYFTVFDPEEYPVKWTFVSGRGSKADQERAGHDQD